MRTRLAALRTLPSSTYCTPSSRATFFTSTAWPLYLKEVLREITNSSWKRDNSGFFFSSDRSGEFRELMFYALADGRITQITRHVKGDIESASTSADGKHECRKPKCR